MFFRISTHSTATPGIPPAPAAAPCRVAATADPGLSPGLSPDLARPPTRPLRPVIPDNARTPPYYRGCWHGVSRCFLTWYRQASRNSLFAPGNRGLRAEALPPPRGVAASAVGPLRDPPLLPPVGVWAVSQSQCVAGHPLRPATRHRLGGPSPRQLADRPRAPLPASEVSSPRMPQESVCGITRPLGRPFLQGGRSLTCYAPVRRLRIAPPP